MSLIWLRIKVFVLLICFAFSSNQNLLTENNIHTQSISISPNSSSSSGIGSIFVGFILGPVLFICSFICIWYNEKRAAIDQRRLELAEQICADVNPLSRNSIQSANDKLIYTTGETRTVETIVDSKSGVSAKNAIKLIRSVEVLQWRRHTKRQNNREIEEFTLVWVTQNSPQEGSRMNNPANWWVSSETFYNSNAFLGEYHINKEVAIMCQKSIPIVASQMNIRTLGSPNNKSGVLNGQYILYGNDSVAGALRVRYTQCPCGPMSVAAKSKNNELFPFDIEAYEGQSHSGGLPACCCCMISACYAEMLSPIKEIFLVHQQNLTRGDVFYKAVEKSRSFTTMMRIGSYCVMVLSICLFFWPITQLLGYIPLIGGLLSGVVGFAILIAAIIVCIPLYLIALAISWLFFHPKVGLILLLFALLTTGAVIAWQMHTSAAETASNPAHLRTYYTLLRHHH